MFDYIVEIKAHVQTEDPLHVGQIARDLAEAVFDNERVVTIICHWKEGTLDDYRD